MGDQYRLSPHSIEIEKHPRWETHYIQEIDIVDTKTGKVAETVKAFDTDGRVAVKQARKLAFAWIAEREKQEDCGPLAATPAT